MKRSFSADRETQSPVPEQQALTAMNEIRSSSPQARTELPLEWPASPGAQHLAANVHHGALSTKLCRMVGARAVAFEDHVAVDDMESLGSGSGRDLLRHELAHVHQWSTGARGRVTSAQLGDRHGECLADDMAFSHRPKRVTGAGKALLRARESTFPVPFGKFDASLAKEGQQMRFDLKFVPGKNAPDLTDIRFVQVARSPWTASKWASEKRGEQHIVNYATQRDEAAGIEGDAWIDIVAVGKTPRAKGQADVSPNYPWTGDVLKPHVYSGDAGPPPQATLGSKKGPTIIPAVMSDQPGGADGDWKFEVVCSAARSDLTLGVIKYGFSQSSMEFGPGPDDPPSTPIKQMRLYLNEWIAFSPTPSKTFADALRRFNKYYNPSTSSGSP